ncbi:3-methyl-2-oxobutanoate hydroxymethyltransferase [Mesorhizobium sp. BAC0120]|uniref:3-methyl-2-oxobutanoate hydroxymethyltransferase n=1 Tax=Mesorhizobium sp. BAC0120 TaxID=3090670 RepID=UPI00298C07BD|nr:3-methyl-2-oxobutanoate hydroxymethyltransferase [Mesorhizobium sp. BAC0120]MDW6026060.1 3-methyl-2-oxobutanoate hydroxymethyltransferase [Mesorhizobium sp. BAC0120]
MKSSRPTIADLLAMKGKRQFAKLRVTTLEQAAAAQAAGIDILSVTPELMTDPQYRDAAPDCFTIPGSVKMFHALKEEVMGEAFRMMRAGADAVYCAASLDTIRALRDEGVPVCGHSGLIPAHATWTGGFRAVGKTAESAMLVWRQVKALEEAGAFAAEIEVVPVEVATAISQRTSLFMISMGAGAGCDAQYLFAEDVLGENRGHYPRHSKVYRNFAAEYDRLQRERIAAFSEYARDVKSKAYPEPRHVVGIEAQELDGFLRQLDGEARG